MREIFCGQKCRVYIADLVHPIWGVKAEVWCCRVHCASRCVETSTTESEKFGCHSEVIKTLRWEGQIIVTGLSSSQREAGGQSET